MLINYNQGEWSCLFARFNPHGLECDRFMCTLSVQEEFDLITAKLTYLESGKTKAVSFYEPPEEMQIAEGGHWSSGPKNISLSNWVTELCLCDTNERRRAVLQHHSEGIEAITLIWEWRTSRPDLEPILPNQIQLIRLEGMLAGQATWSFENQLNCTVMQKRNNRNKNSVALSWERSAQDKKQIIRTHSEDGRLIAAEKTMSYK